MARSRRRTISRQSGSAPRFSYATIAKWGLIALGASGGTYGVFKVVNLIPYGAAAVTDGTEVGPHLAEAASLAKPPLPDDISGLANDPSRNSPNRVANHLNPADTDVPASTIANLTPTPNATDNTKEEQDPPPRPAGSRPGPGIPALPNSLNNNGIGRNLGNSIAAAANDGMNQNGPSSLPSASPDRAGNPSANPNSQSLPSALPKTGSTGPVVGGTTPIVNGVNPSTTGPVTEGSPVPPGGSPNPIANANSATLPSNPATSTDNGTNNGGVGGSASVGLPPSGMNVPRPINPGATPLANTNSGNPTTPNELNPRDGSTTATTPALGPSTPTPNLLGGASQPSNPLSSTGSNPAALNPAANPNSPNTLGNGSAASSLPVGGPPASGLPITPNGGQAGTNPSGSATNSIVNSNTTPTSALPPTRPTIGIPPENRNAGSQLPPNLGAAQPSNPLAATGSIPRSGSSSLPMADPMAGDPRRVPASPANFSNQPNYSPQNDRLARENPPSSGLLGQNVGGPERVAANMVSNRPGDPQWEIQQQAALVVEKLAPPVVQVNVPAKFLMVVRNVGRASAGQVLIRDRVPEKAQLLQATPKPTRQEGDLMEWELPALAAGDAFQIQLELLPTEPGEIGSVAQVTSSTVAATRTRSTRPQLSVQHSGPPQAMVGQTVMMNIIVRNDGDGVAENVMLREIVPPQLMHPAGNEIENPIGTLAPGQTRTLQLPLVAKTPGTARNTIRVSGDGKLSSEHSVDVQIVAPQLQVSAEGPERRFLSRSTTHTFQVTNNGTANATNVQMMARLPQGLRYESSSPEGRYDPSRHAVFWAMAHLPSNANQQVNLTTMPLAPGNQPIEFHALADLNQPQVTTKTLLVEQLSELFFDIDDLQDPIEIGTNTIYVIRVENQGSQVANDVAIVVDIPEGIEPLNIESPVEYQMQRDGQNSRLVLAPIPTMNPRAQLVIRLEARGVREGDHRVEVRMTSAQRPTPVAKQESTKVYRDR